MSQEGKNSNIILFEDFIEFLRTHGYPIGVDTHLKVSRIIESLGAGEPPEKLKTLLAPIFANNTQQQEEFYQLFDAFFEKYEADLALGHDSSKPLRISSEPIKTPGMLKIWSKRRYYLVIQIILMIGVGYLGVQGIDCYVKTGSPQGAAYCVLGLKDPFINRQDTAIIAEIPIDSTGSQNNSTQIPDIENDKPSSPLTKQIPLENGKPIPEDISGLKAGVLQQYGPLLKILIIIAIITAFFFYESYWRNKKKLYLIRERTKKPPFIWTIQKDRKDFRLYTEQQFFEASRKLRERESVDSQDIDIDKTIDQTVESGGYPSLQFQSKSRPPEYLVLIEKNSIRDHQAMLFDQLMLELEQQDLFIERYFYEEDPRLCWKTRYVDEVYLEDLYRKYPDDRLIIVGSADSFFDPVNDTLCSWTHLLKKWKHVAIVTPKCPLTWGHREIEIAKSYELLPSTTEALGRLVDIFNQDSKTSLRYWVDQNKYPIPPEEDSTNLIEDLKIYFDTNYSGLDETYDKGSGKESFTWLTMCAVYPELFWDLTLTLGEVLSVQKNIHLVNPENVFKMVSLPWFRQGEMPDELREVLLKELKEEDMILARQTLVAVLKENPPPEGSYAEAEHQLQIALQEAEISPTIGKNIKLIQEAQNYSINHEIKDFTVIKSLNTIPESVLKISLPRKLKQAIFRQGIPALGAKTWVRGSLGLALVMIIMLTLDPSRLDRVHTFDGEEYFLADKESRMLYHTYVGNTYLNRADSLGKDGAMMSKEEYLKAARENYLKSLAYRDESSRKDYLIPEFNLSYLAWEEGNMDEAKDEFARINDKAEEIMADTSLNSQTKEILAMVQTQSKYNQGVINYRSQEIEEAEEQFRDAVKKDANNTQAIYAEAVLFLQKALNTKGANQQNSFNLAMNRIDDIRAVNPDYFDDHSEFKEVLDSLSNTNLSPQIKTRLDDLLAVISDKEMPPQKEIPLVIDTSSSDDPETKPVFPSQIKYLTDFIEGLALVQYEGKYGFIDQKANLKGIIYEDARPFSEGFAAVKQNGKWGFIDPDLQTVIDFDYEKAMDFKDSWASVKITGKWGMIDRNGIQTIQAIYDSPIEFESPDFDSNYPSLAAVFRNGKYEYIDRRGRLAFGDKKFQYAENFGKNNIAKVKRWEKRYLMDRNGECLPASLKDGKCPTEKWYPVLTKNLTQHSDAVNVAEFSSDGSFILTASSDGTARLYTSDGSKPIAILEHGGKINTAVISPNNRVIATAGEDRLVKIWRRAGNTSFVQVATFSEAKAAVWSLAFSRGNRFLAAGAGDQFIRIYDLNKGAMVNQLKGHTIGSVATLAFAPNGNTLASGGEDKSVRFWDWREGTQVGTISQPIGKVMTMAYSPDGRLLAIGTQNNLTKVFIVKEYPLSLYRQFDQFENWVSSVSFSKDNQYLMATSYDNFLRVWNLETQDLVMLAKHPGTVKSAAISPDGQYILTASWGEGGKNRATIFKIDTYGK